MQNFRCRIGARHPLSSIMLLLGLLTTLTACDPAPPAAQAAAPAQVLPSGSVPELQDSFLQQLQHAELTSRVVGEQEPLLLIEIPPRQYSPRLITAPETGLTPLQAMQNSDVELLIGSGFVTDPSSFEPIGLLQHNGQTLSPVQPHGYTRILGIREDRLEVIHRSAFTAADFVDAMQVGPGIVEDFALDIAERDLQRPRYFRSFVAVCDSMWLVGVSLQPTNLHSVGKRVLSDIAHQSYRCKDVVNLAGDRQAVLLLRSAEGHILYHGDPHAAKVTMLGFSRRTGETTLNPPATGT